MKIDLLFQSFERIDYSIRSCKNGLMNEIKKCKIKLCVLWLVKIDFIQFIKQKQKDGYREFCFSHESHEVNKQLEL